MTIFIFFQTYCMTEHMRMSGMYWGLTALDLMGKLDQVNKQQVLEFIGQCQGDNGGIGASIEHDPHLLYTLSAIQILCIYDALDVIDVEKVVKYVKERQQPDGSFTGDYWGEVDVRFSFCAVATLSLLVSIARYIANASYIRRLVYLIFLFAESFGCDRCRKSSGIHIEVHEFRRSVRLETGIRESRGFNILLRGITFDNRYNGYITTIRGVPTNQQI